MIANRERADHRARAAEDGPGTPVPGDERAAQDHAARPAAVPRGSGTPPPRHGPLRRALPWVVLAVVLAGALAYAPRLLYLLRRESTDDAYVTGHTIVPIAPQVKGRVIELHVTDDQDVVRGQLLVAIDPSDYEVALARAEAVVLREEARLANARSQHARAVLLTGQRVTARQQLEDAEAAEREAEGRLRSARADVNRAELELERTRILAPLAGRIALRSVQLGSFVQPGDRLFALVDLTDVYVRANFKETQIADMRVGQAVDLEADAYPNVLFHGHVESFQAGTGAVFSLLPPENATGQFVKVVQRLPVRIAIERRPGDPILYPGLSVTARVDTSRVEALDVVARREAR